MILNFLKNKNKKIILTALAVVILVATLAPQMARALEQGGVVDIAGGVSVLALAPVLVPLGALLYAVMYISGYIISFIAELANYIIIFGDGILTETAVVAGWQVMLSFTNLGFILGIIIIAFATILHLESYALKQILWKLVVAALLVNFSLVIAGSFISVSKVITNSFYNHITGERANSMGKVLGSLAQPQQISVPPNQSMWERGIAIAGSIVSLFTATGQLNFTVGLIFQILMNFIIILTFATLIVMLLVRAIALIFLLILSPLIWLCWIFPSTQKYWTKWWSEFIKWNFFAPAIMFFIYLAVLTRNIIDSKISGSVSNISNATSTMATAVESTTFFTSLWGSIMNNIVIMALLIGGIFVANKFGIAGGDIGMSLAQKVGKGAAGWAGRKGISGLRRTGSGVLGNEYVKKFGIKLQTLGNKSTAGRWVASLTGVNKLGNVIQAGGVRQGEAAVKDAEKKYGHLSDKELGNRMHQFTAPERQFALQKMAKNNTLGMVAGGAGKYITKDEKERWARRGGDKQFGDFEKTFGADTTTMHALRAGDKAGAKTAMDNFRKKYSIEDYNKVQGEIFSAFHEKDNNLGLSKSQHEELVALVQESVISQHPGAISKIRIKLKGNNLENFDEKLTEHIESQINDEMVKQGYTREGDEKATIDFKLDILEEKNPKFVEHMKRIVKSKRNLGGSLLGTSYFEEKEKKEEKT